ncbi:Uncharacterised protein [Vibrio cholerae]|nr:Uncharacterised protein [Vibrio cholerae]CSI49743.1 Uncharacterised protein [Vibrio cholerae]
MGTNVDIHQRIETGIAITKSHGASIPEGIFIVIAVVHTHG